jgi:hypothetical protein
MTGHASPVILRSAATKNLLRLLFCRRSRSFASLRMTGIPDSPAQRVIINADCTTRLRASLLLREETGARRG